MPNKFKIFTGAIVLMLGLFAFSGKAVAASPWDSVWAAIANLQQQITNIALTPGPVGPPGPAGEPGLTGEAGSQSPQGPSGTAAITLAKGNTVINQTIPGGETRAWTWVIPEGSYLVLGRVNYDLRSSASAAARIECRMREEGLIGFYDSAAGFLSQDQISTIPQLRGVSHSGSMTLVGTFQFNGRPDLHITIECEGTASPDGSIVVRSAGINAVPITSIQRFNPNP